LPLSNFSPNRLLSKKCNRRSLLEFKQNLKQQRQNRKEQLQKLQELKLSKKQLQINLLASKPNRKPKRLCRRPSKRSSFVWQKRQRWKSLFKLRLPRILLRLQLLQQCELRLKLKLLN